MCNKICKRIYYAIDVQLKSPLCISNGEDYYTDADVLTNGNGEYFVPGTSLAGAFRNYLNNKKDEKSIYGYSKGSEGRMSSVFISDIYLTDVSVSVRDRVKLTDTKTVDNKFDVQIIEPGAKGTLYLEYVERVKDKYDFKTVIADVLYAISKGDVRIGADKTRGFGELTIGKVASIEFSPSDCKKWEEFIPLAHSSEGYPKWEEFSEWVKQKTLPQSKYVTIVLPLELKGGISIRKYSALKDRPDYEHITSNGNPVIPGTSWNGAIRSDARRILQMLGCKNANAVIDQWFGFVKEGNVEQEERAAQSMITIGESTIEGSQGMTVTRNKIDRFSGGTVTGALYSEYAYFGGHTTLEVKVKKDISKQYEAALGLIMLVLKDLQKGYISVGGQGAIGRGIFALRKDKNWIVSEDQTGFDKGRYLKALYQLVKEGGSKE